MSTRMVFHTLLLVVGSLIALPLAAQSSGSCFDCNFHPYPEPPMTVDYNCVTISSGEYGSCSERIVKYDPDGNVTEDQCVMYEASYCPDNGGGSGGGGGDNGGGGADDQTDECSTSGGWGGCPAQCSRCW